MKTSAPDANSLDSASKAATSAVPRGQMNAQTSAYSFRAGLCPRCKKAQMDYDGCLVLHCPACNYREAGAFT